jgi:hypothetical protein
MQSVRTQVRASENGRGGSGISALDFTAGEVLELRILNKSGGHGLPAASASFFAVTNQDAGKYPLTMALLTAVALMPRAEARTLRPTLSANSEVVIMTQHNPPMVNFCNPTIGKLPLGAGAWQTVATMNDERPDYSEIGSRLRALRLAFGPVKQVDWCEKHNFNQSQWNNWEKGTRRISVDSAERLCETYGLTLDWVYRGRRDGLAETASKVL